MKKIIFLFIVLVFVAGAVIVRADTIFKGVGWSAMDGAGIGWISVSNSSQEPGRSGTHSTTPYGVSVDNAGLLHGAMWAGHKSNPNVGWGWLSFNASDLAGCPESEQSSCTAQLGSDGKISGWARFINATNSSWSGWVKLRDGNEYGLCFGDSSIKHLADGSTYYSGESCTGNGSQTNNFVSGSVYAGGEGELGGWIVFASSSLGIINPNSSSTDIFFIQPPGPHKIAIRDKKLFWANKASIWFVDNVRGGNNTYGKVFPDTSGRWVEVPYTAPNTLPQNPDTKIKASTTEPYIINGVDEEDIEIVPPYSMVCLPEGQTSIRLIITKNYFRPDYDFHNVKVYGDEEEQPKTIIASNPNGMTSFVHTDLSEETRYYYKLETIFSSPAYLIETPIITCRTGDSTTPLGAVTGVNAYANNPNTIIVNWKDDSKLTSAYEFELQRIKVTPDRDYTLSFEASGAGSVDISWDNVTLWVPYNQELLKSDDNGRTFGAVAGGVYGWTGGTPPTSILSYTFQDVFVTQGRQYQYKLKVCAALDLKDVYSTPVKGGTAKPPIVCVESDSFSYTHSWSGGNQQQSRMNTAVASLIDVAENAVRFMGNVITSITKHVVNTWSVAKNFLVGIFSDKGMIHAATQSYSAYFKTTVITKNPAYKDTGLEADTVYLYRVSILSGDQVWSELRAAKTLKDDIGGLIENRPVCMRNSFCDMSILGVQSGDTLESSEQQCYVNKDCVNVGRSDQGFQER